MLPEVIVIVIALPLLWLAVLTWLMASVTLRLRDLARRDELHHVASEMQSKASRADLSTLQADFARLDAGIERLSERTAHLVDRLDSIHDILMKRP